MLTAKKDTLGVDTHCEVPSVFFGYRLSAEPTISSQSMADDTSAS